MRIASTQFTLETKSFEIYISGCNTTPKCEGCHNPELWNFNMGIEYNQKYFEEIKNKILNAEPLVKNIFIMGGEPNDQVIKDLFTILSDMESLNKKLWLFTSWELKSVPWFAKLFCDYIKCGRYIEKLKTDINIQYGIKLATLNQKIYKRGIDY